jgi:lipopolysaccharide transport system ATP-binding protein
MQSICDRAILLDGGRLAKQGSPEEVMDYYNALIAEREGSRIEQVVTAKGRVQTSSGSGEAEVIDIVLENEQGTSSEIVNVGAAVSLRVKVRVNAPVPRLVLGYMIKDRLGQQMYGTNTHHMDCPLDDLKAGDELQYVFRFPLNLGPGSYSITTALTSTKRTLPQLRMARPGLPVHRHEHEPKAFRRLPAG